MNAREPSTVSVIIPVYNGEQFLRETVQSVLKQKYKKLDVIIVDDGSVDGCRNLLSGIRDHRIRYYFQNNIGISSARNRGIKESSGEYISFLDQDDLLHPEKISKAMRILVKRRDIGVIYCETAAINSQGEKLNAGRSVFHERPSGNVRKEFLTRNIVPGTAGLTMRYSCLNKAGLFNEQLNGADDWEMWARISTHCHFQFIPEVLAYVRFHEENTSNDVTLMRNDALRTIDILFSNTDLTAEIPRNELEQVRRRAYANLHSYCANRLFITRNERDALPDLTRALRYHPQSLREWALLPLSLLGWSPDILRRRLI